MEPVRIDVGPQLNIPVKSVSVKLYTSPQELVMRNNDRDIELRTIAIKHPNISSSSTILRKRNGRISVTESADLKI
jgi:hypothetical protein